MEPSPLTQQNRPTSFQPKIAQLYDDLFQQDEQPFSDLDGFWNELFLLKPDKARLQQRLERLTVDDLLNLQHETQQLFVRSIHQIKTGKPPTAVNALDTLTVFLGVTLSKRYMNPSADIISVLAGLDDVDAVFFEFANVIEYAIRTGGSLELRTKAVDVALSLTSGAYQTSLVSYFTNRDLFPALIKLIQDFDDPAIVFKPFLLLGLLANYNKFEFRNPYRLRLEDFVNETAIVKIVRGIGFACAKSRDHYVAIQEDVAEGWTLSNTLSYLSFGVLAPGKGAKPPPPKLDDTREGFAVLPDPGAALMLGLYDFTNANKVFCQTLISCPSNSKAREPPLSAFLSYTSYILHHAYRSVRADSYGMLNLLILRLLIEDLNLCKTLCNPEIVISPRLCRQRQPFLPATPTPRSPAAAILDILVDTVNHNLRRQLSIPLYISTIGLIHRLLSYLTFTRTRLQYHWSLLWQTLLSFMRFLTTYAPSLLVQDPDLPQLINPFLATLALAVISGESFLPDPAAYDDLFYKLVEAGDYLERFKKAFHPHFRTPPSPNAKESTKAPIDILIQVSTHYHDLVEEEKAKGKMSNNLSPREVSKIIRQGYETLNLSAIEGLDRWDRFKESDERGMLKKIARVAVDDTRKLLR